MANDDITELIELMKKLSKLLAEKDLEVIDDLDNIREEENKRNEKF